MKIAALVVATVDAVMWYLASTVGWVIPGWGIDFATYRDAASRLLSGGSFYFPYQFTGPYFVTIIQPQPVLYPPTTIPLFAAFTVLPSVLWWTIPISVTIFAIALHRPSRTAWLVMALLMLWPSSLISIQTGNPVMWIVAALAVGTHVPALSPLVLLKPTLAPFALGGIWRRSWWIGLAVLVVVSIPFAGMWLDYLTILANARGADALYSMWQFPIMLVPLVARSVGSRGERVTPFKWEADTQEVPDLESAWALSQEVQSS